MKEAAGQRLKGAFTRESLQKQQFVSDSYSKCTKPRVDQKHDFVPKLNCQRKLALPSRRVFASRSGIDRASGLANETMRHKIVCLLR